MRADGLVGVIMDEARGPWTGHLTKPAQQHTCEAGWICEQHPEQGWPHDDCAGPGMPCLTCNRESPPRMPRDWQSKVQT
jgi:hypothetical protein